MQEVSTSYSADTVYVLALLGVDGVGPAKAKNLIAYCGSAKAAFEVSKAKLLHVPEVGPGVAESVVRAHQRGDILKAAEAELAWCDREGVRVWSYLDADYPAALKTEAHLPMLLYQRGPLNLNAKPAVAVVGTRTPTDYGRRQAARFATALAEAGVNVVSGLAYGIDAEAHKATLAAGVTTAVLGHGLERIYPAKHAGLARQIIERGGAVLTEFPRGVGPEPQNFPHRNRIIAGLCRATIVIEAAETGGALITGRLAFELNREVYALPGSVEQRTATGCHRLIQHNVAKLVTDPAEVLADLDLDAKQPRQTKQAAFDFTAQEAEVMRYLAEPAGEGRLLDQLADQTGLPVGELMSRLLELEFKGAVRQLPGRKFVRA